MSSRSYHETDIFNGAQCKAYSWSQSHTDLEIRIKLTRPIRNEDLRVTVSKKKLCIELIQDQTNTPGIDLSQPVETLVIGEFEHPVDTESACWFVDSVDLCLTIYIDKKEEMWWKQLLLNEEVTAAGPKSYSVPMDQLDECSRMVIDKLITDQKKKMIDKSDYFSPV